MGDGSPKDNFKCDKKQTLLQSFLDYVDKEEGELIILGDFLELWGHRLESVIGKQGPLLDRLADMKAVFVPGNHDAELLSWENMSKPPHVFFEATNRPFVRTIRGKRFKFMHGHEADPFVQGNMKTLARALAAYTPVLALERTILTLSNDVVVDVALELGENVLRLWDWITGNLKRTFQECCSVVPNDTLAVSKRRIRTRKMLTRYYQDKGRDLYDVAIVGHTHKPGRFGDWYFNSGSWTGRTNNFLCISPDGRVEVSDWDENGPHIRTTSLRD
ncbi:MAG: metallophosphoesterase [Sedimentisphaerales bacterium]|nr:metallophosphoesterase [Sedimentisphaerales bacterium]